MNQDLLQPTLTTEDEPTGIHEPLDTGIILLITFFFGIVTGGLLLAWNFIRLGMPKYIRATLVIAILCHFCTDLTGQIVVKKEIVDVKKPQHRTLLRTAKRVVYLLTAFAIVRKQKKALSPCSNV